MFKVLLIIVGSIAVIAAGAALQATRTDLLKTAAAWLASRIRRRDTPGKPPIDDRGLAPGS